jgi:hypothetical protein
MRAAIRPASRRPAMRRFLGILSCILASTVTPPAVATPLPSDTGCAPGTRCILVATTPPASPALAPGGPAPPAAGSPTPAMPTRAPEEGGRPETAPQADVADSP